MTIPEIASLVGDLAKKARNAAEKNKPLMWAYYSEVRRVLAIELDGQNPGEVASQALALHSRAHAICQDRAHHGFDAALWWAVGVYARRILRALGWPAPRANLAWLRLRVWGYDRPRPRVKADAQ